MKILLLISLIFYSSISSAQNKKEISEMLNQLEKSGVFNAEERKAAEAQLLEMNNEEMNSLIQKATKQLDNPEIQKQLKKIQK